MYSSKFAIEIMTHSRGRFIEAAFLTGRKSSRRHA